MPNSVLTQLAQSTRVPPPQQFGSASQPPSPSQLQQQQQVIPQQFDPGAGPSDAQQQQVEDDGVDTSALPPVKAPSSHPSIDPSETGVYDGRSILEFDLNALTDKPWRRPGSDISDWFNYGFDEISWEAYCYRRRDLGDLAHVLKTNIIVRFLSYWRATTQSLHVLLQNFSGMNEDQLTVLPPEVHTMVMTGANVAMNNAAQGMMGGGPGMMMDHMSMGPGGMVGPMGMDMNNMNMGGGMISGMMQDGVVQGQPGGMGMNPADTGVGVGNAVGMMADGFAGGAQGGMMNMNMGDYSMQVCKRPFLGFVTPNDSLAGAEPDGSRHVPGNGRSTVCYACFWWDWTWHACTVLSSRCARCRECAPARNSRVCPKRPWSAI